MKKFLPLLLCLLVLITSAFAENAGQPAPGASFIGTWIENDGFGTLTLRADGTSHMLYYDNTVTECHWEPTESGGRFTDGQWLNSPMKLLDDNTLSVADGWMVFTREGFLPATDQALLLDATPVGDEGLPFLGEWTLVSLIEEGIEYDPALLSITMTIRFNADGTVLTNDGMGDYTTTWSVSYGSAVVEGDILTISENGQLICNVSDGSMIFDPVLPEIPEPMATEPVATEPVAAEPVATEPVATEPVAAESEITFTPVGEEGAAFLGTWTLEAIDAEGMTMSPDLLGMSMTLTFTEDGRLTFTDDLDTEVTSWAVEGGTAIVEDLPLTLTEDGKLVMTDDGAAMIFTQGEVAPANESSDADELMALLEILALLEETGSDDAGFDYVDTKFVCTQFSTSGVTLDAATLGSEYAVFFRSNNTADLTLAGYTIENLPYVISEDGVYVINYYGAFFNCTPTETGFDVDYYGTMTLHCAPAV